jgi:hypothetical protein
MTSTTDDKAPKKPRMSTRNRVLFLLTGWLIVLMPFLFWWNTWFGRNLTDQQLTEYLHDDKKPRHIQQALVQIGERISHGDKSVGQWYPDALRLASYPVEEVRNTDAWVMGQDTSGAGFHDALLKMLNDPSLMVRGNAALSLVRFGDASGKPQVLELLRTQTIVAPGNGTISDTGTAGSAVRGGGVVAKLTGGDRATEELRSPITGRIRSISTAKGAHVVAGQEVATIAPDTEQVWEALRALYLIGQTEDIAAVTPYERELPDISDRVRQQATETEAAIRAREK